MSVFRDESKEKFEPKDYVRINDIFGNEVTIWTDDLIELYKTIKVGNDD